MWSIINNAIAGFNWWSALDLFLLFLLFYYLLLIVKGTKSYPMIIGLSFIGFIAAMSSIMNLIAFSFILNKFLTYLIIAIIVLFQEEIRNMLMEIGISLKLTGEKNKKNNYIDELINAVIAMSLTKTGALIAIEREISLQNAVNKPQEIDASVTKELLMNIFFKNSPLHDGAVLIRKGRIALARCFFPLPAVLDLTYQLGTRHLAARGITQQSDAIAIVVSEETGKISLAVKGDLIRGLDREGLRNRLKGFNI